MNRVAVTPELLRWAVARAGVSRAELSRKFPRFERWERGEEHPTLKQVERFANATHTPVGYLFLPVPPIETVPIPDFRTVANVHVEQPSADLLDTVYLCQQRQDWYREHCRMSGQPPSAYVGSVRITDDVVITAARMRRALHFDVDERSTMSTWTEALRRFIEQADSTGILVMSSGVVHNNNRRRLNPDEFRGFALADEFAPLVFVNGADTKAAQMFTLAHELAHIWLGQSAVSDAQASRLPENAVEKWCNQVAAEFLVPLELVVQERVRAEELRSDLDRLARRFKVSTLVVLRRLHDAGALARGPFWAAYEDEVQRLRAFTTKSAGGDFYLTLGARASKRFARALVVSTLEGQTSFTEAFRMLGLRKMATFHELGTSLGVGA